MRKRLLACGIGTLAMLFAVTSFAVTAKEAPETATLDQCMAKKAAVEFPHATHWELTECTTCHHTQEGLTADSDMEVETCVSCHKEPEAAETPSCTEMSLTKNPYHVGCVDCHKESGSENAPTKCDECHPKAE